MRVRVVGALAALAVLVGCTPGPAAQPGVTPTPLAVPSALVAQREAAGIADCPATTLTADAVGGGLPDLVLQCLGSGRQVNLAALRGRPMVVNFWAQWCGPCRLEAPHLRAFHEAWGERVLVLGVDFADPDPALALEFAAYAGWTYPHVRDPLKQTSGPLRFTGIPITLFVTADGRIVHRYVGAFSSTEQIAGLAERYLGVQR